MAGSPVSALAELARERGLSGLEFAFSLPGTVGGAVWMNARCYDREVSDVLEYAVHLDDGGAPCRCPSEKSRWSYKLSPYQALGRPIVQAGFLLEPGDPVASQRPRNSALRRSSRKVNPNR